MEIQYGLATTDDQVKEIIALQAANLKINLSEEEIATQGFVTAHHTFEQLRHINNIEPTRVAFHNGKIVAYAIAMTPKAATVMPIFDQLLQETSILKVNGEPISMINYIFVGQLCVHNKYRGIGIVPGLYSYFKESLKDKYDVAITDVSSLNPRSIKAHQKSGYEVVATFYDEATDSDWKIVMHDFRK